jgi:hypothetical protein
MIEYHGWVTLCCSAAANWDDGQWDTARDEIEHQISRFRVDDGHWVAFAETTESIQALQLSGYTEQDISPLLQLMEFVGRTVPDSYGELVVLQHGFGDLSTASRYRLAAGRVSRL